MLKIGLKPAMAMSLSSGNTPLEQLNTIIDYARAARDAGFRSIWAGQHYFGGSGVRWEVVPLLARLIPEIKECEGGTCILLLPLHHPVLIAEQVAVLDIISGGKFFFGVGLGYRQREFDGFGVLKRDRARRFEEALAIIKMLWTQDAVSFAGRHFQIDNLSTATRPLQKPSPPVWIAAHGDNAVRRAARLGDGLMMNPHASIETLERQLEIYRDALAQESKPLPDELSIRKDIFIAETREKAWEEAEREIPRLVKGFNAEKQYNEMPAADMPDVEQDLKTFIRARYIVGDPHDCMQQIEIHRRRLHVGHFIFRVACPGGNRVEMMKKILLIGREVIRPLGA